MSTSSLRALLFIAASSLAACAAAPPRVTTPAEEPAAPEEVAPAVVAPAPVVSMTKEERRSTGTISRRELVQVLDGAPGRFLQHVDTEPRFVGGRFRGWKVAAFFPGDERFATVDLQPGDVILAVNGQSIEQPDQLMRVWEALRLERALVVSLERAGQPRQLRYEIRD